MQITSALLIGALALSACSAAERPDPLCETRQFSSQPYILCAADAAADDIRLFHSDDEGQAFRTFDALKGFLQQQDRELVFAMNGGMYHDDRSPVGLYIDGAGRKSRLNLNEGPGNFHMLPNGVFVLDSGTADVLESSVFAEIYDEDDPDYATQSGPMLVISGEIHPSINSDGTSRKRRNGVGVSADGDTVFFLISEVPVTFHEFASVFRDDLEAPNALFLDGVVSKVYSSDLGRNEQGLDMGPMAGVVR